MLLSLYAFETHHNTRVDQPCQVLLISAREALLSRLYLLGHASDRDRAALILRAFGRFGQPPTQDQLLDAATRMLQASGVPELESTVLSFLYTKAGLCVYRGDG